MLSSLSVRYKSVVECERVTVWTFEGQESVSSFRSVVPSQQYLKLMETVLSSEQTYTPWTVGEQRTRRVHPMGGEEGGGGPSEVESSPQGQAAPEQLSKSEARRLRKEQRKREVGCAANFHLPSCVLNAYLISSLFLLAVGGAVPLPSRREV